MPVHLSCSMLRERHTGSWWGQAVGGVPENQVTSPSSREKGNNNQHGQGRSLLPGKGVVMGWWELQSQPNVPERESLGPKWSPVCRHVPACNVTAHNNQNNCRDAWPPRWGMVKPGHACWGFLWELVNGVCKPGNTAGRSPGSLAGVIGNFLLA